MTLLPPPARRTLLGRHGRARPGLDAAQLREALEELGRTSTKLGQLRHTFATLALKNGISMLDVCRLLGHASYAVTDGVYAHLRKRDWSDERARITAANARHAAEPVPLRGAG